MRSIPKIGLMLLLLAVGGACKRFANPFAERNTMLAEVAGEKLYQHDIAAIFTPGISAEDSLKILRSYVDQWVKKQLKITEAERLFESNQKDIDRLVAEYRNSLLTHKVDQFYVDRNLDTLFTQEQIAAYYNENKSDFILDKTLLKGRIVRLPREYDNRKSIEALLRSPTEESYQDLLDLCVKNNFALTELNQWTDFATLLSLLPTDRQTSYDYLLDPDKVNRFETDDAYFYVRVTERRQPGEYIPLEHLSDAIRRVIFNQRKEAIIRNLEDSLYRSAVTQENIVVHLKDTPVQ